MPTTYPKSYILERIAARKNSLQRKIDEAEAVMSEMEAGNIEAIRYNADELLRRLNNITPLIADVRGALELNSPSTLKKKWKELTESIQALNHNTGLEPVRWRDDFGGIYLGSSDRAVGAAKFTLDSVPRELAALEHAEAYLTDTPVDEFTLTGLGKLGLIDAIKFDLGAAKEAKR